MGKDRKRFFFKFIGSTNWRYMDFDSEEEMNLFLGECASHITHYGIEDARINSWHGPCSSTKIVEVKK